MKGLTKRQAELLEYIEQFIGNNRYSPSYREICEHFSYKSLGSVFKHILALKKKGLLCNESKASRSLSLLTRPAEILIQNELQVPFIGNISAGIPIQTFSQTQHIFVPRSLVHAPEKTYALRVQGESLEEEMIADGDLLLVEARQKAHPGETVVALINNHDTIIKKYYPEGEFAKLLGSQRQHHPILLRLDDLQIQGIVIGLLRVYG